MSKTPHPDGSGFNLTEIKDSGGGTFLMSPSLFINDLKCELQGNSRCQMPDAGSGFNLTEINPVVSLQVYRVLSYMKTKMRVVLKKATTICLSRNYFCSFVSPLALLTDNMF